MIGSTMFAVPFDVEQLKRTGAAVPAFTNVARTIFGRIDLGGIHFSVGDDGTVAYLTDPGSSDSGRLASIDRQTGKATALNVPAARYEHPRVSRDGKQIAVGIVGSDRKSNVWIHDLTGTTSIRQLTFEGSNRHPVWSSDGVRVVFQSDRDGDRAIFWQRADGTAPAERLTKPEQGTAHVPGAWSPDGNTLLFAVEPLVPAQAATRALWMLRDGKTQAFGGVVTNVVFAIAPVFSPDGRWVAYASSSTPTSGTVSTYVQPFPATGAKYLVAEGIHPLWSRDELFLQEFERFTVRRVSTAPAVAFSSSIPLTNVRPRVIGINVERDYDILPGGLFLSMVAEDTPSGPAQSFVSASQVQVVVNWLEELRRLAPVK
jgi:dipeptidyl aminopeptidase/acylaminoacyl peptidase